MGSPDEDVDAAQDISADAIAAHLVARVPRAAPDETAGGVRSRLVGASYDSVVDVAVCDGDRLAGLLTIERLLAAPPDARVGDVMGSSTTSSPPAGRPRSRSACACATGCRGCWSAWRVRSWPPSSSGADPAFGSGPLATVVQDLLSLLIYFTVAAVIVT